MGLGPRESTDLQINNLSKTKSPFVLAQFAKDLFSYLSIRIRQFFIFFYAGIIFIASLGTGFKAGVVRRMFWGRSSLYRTAFHSIVAVLTLYAVLSGLASRLNIFAADENSLDLGVSIAGREDIFSQSGTAESISVIGENEPDYPVYKHIVQNGETISTIGSLYGINKDTIKWANYLSSDTIRVGQVLRIPGIDGAFVKVQRGDTLQKIASRTKYKGDAADIADLNRNLIDPNNPILKEGMELFVPGGVIVLPPVAINRSGGSTVEKPGGTPIDVAPGQFVNPLLNCPGYIYIRGFSLAHDGIDLAKPGGCWINAIGPGKVIRAGYGSGGVGNHVVIDHGNGIHSRYFHGNGRFAVKVGDTVKAGQSIMYMGRSGNATGVHLHLEIAINNKTYNPEKYVKVR